MTTEERFWSKVEVGGPDDCWPWTGATNEEGYGRFQIGTHKKSKVIPAHRFAAGATNHNGPVRHSCDNPPCCNRAHLKPGTPLENAAEMVARNRQARGSRHGSAKLTESNVPKIRRLAQEGVAKPAIAARFGVKERTIYEVLEGTTWGHVR